MKAEEYLVEHWLKKPQIHRYNPDNKNHHYDRLQSCANLAIGDTFIDVGCACGDSTNMMRYFHPGTWTGLDFYEPIIEMAKFNYPDIPFYYSPDYNYESITGKHDSVICSEVIEHIEQDRLFVEKLISIANKRAILTTPRKNVGDPGHLRLYTYEMLQKLFSGYKYDISQKSIFFYIVVDLE